jgi:hypothetical protein
VLDWHFLRGSGTFLPLDALQYDGWYRRYTRLFVEPDISMAIHTPDWVKHAVFDQIFPDRFARRPHRTPPRGIQWRSWGSPPEQQGFQGGDLLGIVDKLDYLQDLGVAALYLTPIFASASNHRYHTYDYD